MLNLQTSFPLETFNVGFALFLSLKAQFTPCNVTFYTSNYGSQIHENPDHCSLKIYPLTMFLNWTDNEEKTIVLSLDMVLLVVEV